MNFKCPQCEKQIEIGEMPNGAELKCPSCGGGLVLSFAQNGVNDNERSAEQSLAKRIRELDIKKMAAGVHGKFNEFTGLEKLEGFSLRDLIADIFKRHNRDEVEEFFTVGTASTTPPIQSVDTSWPRPWMFFRALTFSAIVYFLFNLSWETFKNPNLIPGLIAVGTIAVPVSALVFFFEINVRRNISLYVMLRLVMLGGIVSLIFSLVLFELPLANVKFLGASVAGLIEEPGKLLALLVIARSSKYRYKINGLLMGAAIGAGFAIFESMGYAFRALLISKFDKDFMTDIIMMRGVLSPFGHIAWTAICGAALWRVKGGRPFSFGMLLEGRFWHLAIVPVILHMIWNADFTLPYCTKNIGLGVIAWIIILALIQEGLKELRKEKIATIEGECDSMVTQDT